MEHLLLSLAIILFLVAAGVELNKPRIEWKPCSCKEPLVLGLSQQDFIVHQMYMQGLEYELKKCSNKSKLN